MDHGCNDGCVYDEICESEDMRKMFVGNIHKGVEDDELKHYFEEQTGDTTTYCHVFKKDAAKYHMGLVTFSHCDTPDQCFMKRDNLEIRGVKLEIKRAVPKTDTTPGAHERCRKLFIANLPKENFDEAELTEYFEKRHPKEFGEIEKILLIKDKAPGGGLLETNKGFGFIHVTNEDLADRMAIQHRNFMFRGRKIEVKKCVQVYSADKEMGGGFRGRGRGSSGPPRGGRGGRGGGYGSGGYGGGYGGGYDDHHHHHDSYGGYDQGGYGQGGYGGGWDDGYGGGYGGGDGGYGADGYGQGYGQQSRGGGRGRGAPRGGGGGRGTSYGRGGSGYTPY